MPSKIPTRKLVSQQKPDWQIDYLLTGRLPAENQENCFDLLDWRFPTRRFDPAKKLWTEECGHLLKSWLRSNPGTRPFAWWRYNSQEPRKRLGGSGRPIFEVLAYSPSYTCGLPNHWVTQIEADCYPDSQKVRDGVVDPDNPPVFESQAAYLDRLGLLLPSEKSKADFLPEILKINPETGRLVRD